MVEQGLFFIESNELVAKDAYRLVLSGEKANVTAPGQFVNIAVDGLFLRRPISVCDWSQNSLTLIYKAVGRGTDKLCAMAPGSKLDLLTGLGNGYDCSKGRRPLVIGGGVGAPPMYGLAKALIGRGAAPKVLLGFNAKEELLLTQEFAALGCPVLVSTADGSAGKRGFVTDHQVSAGEFDYYYACGPEPMLKAVTKAFGTKGQLSFERRMGCGFGACMGCSCQTLTGGKRICVEGPVLEAGEVLW